MLVGLPRSLVPLSFIVDTLLQMKDAKSISMAGPISAFRRKRAGRILQFYHASFAELNNGLFSRCRRLNPNLITKVLIALLNWRPVDQRVILIHQTIRLKTMGLEQFRRVHAKGMVADTRCAHSEKLTLYVY